MKKITAFLLALMSVLTSFCVSLAANNDSADNVISSGYISSTKAGNIFSVSDKSIKFTQRYENIANATAKIQSVYQVLDEDGVRIKEYPAQSVEIGAGKTASVEFIVENPGKYGLYTLKVTNSITVNGVIYTKTYEEGFSVCITLSGKNIDPDFGFSQQVVSRGYGDVDVTPALMRKAGAQWYRDDCMTWSSVEKSKGVYTIPAGTKEKLQKIKDSGLEIICILNGTNGALYNFPASEESINAFAEYCRFVARELDGIVDHYEIWNEWNKKMETDTAGYYLKTEVYAEVLTKASNAVKDVNENNTVIGCTTAGIDYEWIDGVLTNLSDKSVIDAVSVHCYPWSKWSGVDITQYVNYTESLKEVLSKHSLDIPIWLTEVGFSTFTGETTWIDPCTQEQQLNSLVLVNALNKGYGLFDKLIQYCFYDRANSSGIESNWGLLHCWQRGYTANAEAELTPNGAKPSYLGIAAMNYFTGGNTEFLEMIKSNNDRAYMFKFRNDNMRKNVMLCINGYLRMTTDKTVELDTNKVKIYDKYGNFVEEMTSETGTFKFTVSAEPMYVTWPFEGEEDENGNFLNVTVNENTKTVTIKGTVEEAGDLVSVMVVSKGEQLNQYTPERVLFVGQTKADDYGEYNMSFVMPELKGQFEVNANSKMRKEKQMEDLVLSYVIPEIKIMQYGKDVFKFSELDTSESIDIELRGFSGLEDEAPALVIAQYADGRLVSASIDEDAWGDCTRPGDEIKMSFKTEAGVDSIKVMYMNISKAKPFIAAYEIE